MRVIWRSRQGRERRNNSDAVIVGKQDPLVFCMLVDAAERSENSHLFGRHWGSQIVSQLRKIQTATDPETVVTLLRHEQGQLRYRYLQESASYCLLIIDAESGRSLTYHVGDCLVGTLEAGKPFWWFNPHTLDREAGMKPEQRHILTRSLNARRFCAPITTEKRIAPNEHLIMATDGYWAESQILNPPQDDASYATIEPGTWDLISHSDAENCIWVD